MSIGQGHKALYVMVLLVILMTLPFLFSGTGPGTTTPVDPSDEPAGQKSAESFTPPATSVSMAPDIPQEITARQLLGKVNPASDARFVVIEPRFASRSGMYMHQQAYQAFVAMQKAALEEGIHLKIVSALRTFEHQKRIWNNKWNGSTVLHGNVLATDIADPVDRALEILRFSAMPGTSRHHWGTDVDLNSLQNDYFLSGPGKEIYHWLTTNASHYGFFQPYTAHGQGREGGYEEEKWHWSYHPLASRYQAAYPAIITYEQITGFEGWQTARLLDVISNYVMQVANPH